MTNAGLYYLLACDTNDIVLCASPMDGRFSCPRCDGALLWVCRIENKSVYRCLDRAVDASTRPTLRLPSHEGDRLCQDQNEPSDNNTRTGDTMSTIPDIMDDIENASNYIQEALGSADAAATTAGYARDAAENADQAIDALRTAVQELDQQSEHRSALEGIRNIINVALAEG